MACTIEFYLRPDGLIPMQRAYRFGLDEQNIVRMAATAIYDALREDASIDVGLVFSTDGRIEAFDFIVLEDDQRFFPSYLLTPVIRKRVLDQQGALAGPSRSEERAPTRGPLFSLFSLALQTAIDGGGVLIGRQTLVWDALRDGRIVCPFNLSLPAADRLTLLLPGDGELPARHKDLVEWFRRETLQTMNSRPDGF